MTKIWSFNATHPALTSKWLAVWKIWGAFFFCQQKYHYQCYSHDEKEVFVGHCNNPPRMRLNKLPWVDIQKKVSPSASVFTHKKWRRPTFHHSENVHPFHPDSKLFWREAALFKHWAPQHETLEKIPCLSTPNYSTQSHQVSKFCIHLQSSEPMVSSAGKNTS